MFPRPSWPPPPLLGARPAPPFPQPPAWWNPGAAPPTAGGKGDFGKGGKGGHRGKGSSGGRGGGGGRGRRGSGPNDEAQGFYNPSFVENPWRDLIPNEPATFAYRGAASACGSASLVSPAAGFVAEEQPGASMAAPPPTELPAPTMLAQAGGGSPRHAEELHAAADELSELLHEVTDPDAAQRAYPIVVGAIERVQSILREAVPPEATMQPPKRSRISLPPPTNAV